MAEEGLVIQMFSIHGLLRSKDIEMGRDADTGGQIKYVLELAETLSGFPEVKGVDLFTRRVRDDAVSEDYSREIEEINDKCRIVRIRCGGDRYIRKELLWPYMDEFSENVVKFNQAHGITPSLFHGHYADGGLVASKLANEQNIPCVFTGHSLGRVKKARLLESGMTEDEVNAQYNIDLRIAVEEKVLQAASLIVTSTRQERDDQYGMYAYNRPEISQVILPGVGIQRFYPYYDIRLKAGPERDEQSLQAQASMYDELKRFFLNMDKPLILSLCRPDRRKNIAGLIENYGEDKSLQAMANLAVFAGLRKNIADMGENEKEVLTDMLLLMDRYDLYGKMAIPKSHTALDVPALYRIAASQKGVFVNPALTEPFGLTLIEAAGCGLPVVATNDGGPVEIISNCKNGITVDVQKPGEIAKAVKSIIVDWDLWKKYSSQGINGVHEHYTWKSHCNKYLEALKNRQLT